MAAKLLWRGAECWNECMKLLGIAEAAAMASCDDFGSDSHRVIVRRRSFLSLSLHIYIQVQSH